MLRDLRNREVEGMIWKEEELRISSGKEGECVGEPCLKGVTEGGTSQGLMRLDSRVAAQKWQSFADQCILKLGWTATFY